MLSPESYPITIAIGTAVVNFVWSSLNLRLLRSMEIRFVTHEQFAAAQILHKQKHVALEARLIANEIALEARIASNERLHLERSESCRNVCGVKLEAIIYRLEKAGA